MQIDYCLILAAGFGTRMGEIGKSLPKVLWPIFERSLLELQVEYAKSLGIQKIFINLHHQKDIILDYVQNKSVFEGKKVGLILTGGNVDLAKFADWFKD